jgi:hypothetical protein
LLLLPMPLPVLLLLWESLPDSLMPLLPPLLLLLGDLGVSAFDARSLMSGVLPAAVLPPTAPNRFIQRPTSAIGLLVVVLEGTALPGIIIFISPIRPMSAAALLSLLLLPPSLLLLLLLLLNCLSAPPAGAGDAAGAAAAAAAAAGLLLPMAPPPNIDISA